MDTPMFPQGHSNTSTLANWQAMGIVLPQVYRCPGQVSEGKYLINIPLMYAQLMLKNTFNIRLEFPSIDLLSNRSYDLYWQQAEHLDCKWFLSKLVALQRIGLREVDLKSIVPTATRQGFNISLKCTIDPLISKLNSQHQTSSDVQKLRTDGVGSIRAYLNGAAAPSWDSCIIGDNFMIMIQSKRSNQGTIMPENDLNIELEKMRINPPLCPTHLLYMTDKRGRVDESHNGNDFTLISNDNMMDFFGPLVGTLRDRTNMPQRHHKRQKT